MAETNGPAVDEQTEAADLQPVSPVKPAESQASPDALQASPEADLDVLRRSWQFAAAVQFCRMFRTLLRIRPFSADIFERALLDPSGHRMFLSELLCKLLRPDTSAPYSEQDCDTWEELLHQRLRTSLRSAFVDGNPLADRGFYAITPSLRVHTSHGNHNVTSKLQQPWLIKLCCDTVAGAVRYL